MVQPRTHTILVISSDPQERMRLVRRFLKDGFDVDAYGLWHPSLIEALDVCDAAVVDTQSYAQVLLATTEIPDTMDPPRCVVIADDERIADRLRRALRLEIFIRPVNAADVSTTVRKLCCTPGIESLGASISEPIDQALMRWAREERTIAIEGRWRHERGIIYVDGGEIFHARAGMDVGEEALDRMLYWPENERRFWTLTALRPQKQTIYGDPELALLDAGHRAREIKARVEKLGGIDSVWTFDWRAFQEQESELPFSVDQLLPWLEGTDYLARKLFVPDAALSTTLRVVEDLASCGVLRRQDPSQTSLPQTHRRDQTQRSAQDARTSSAEAAQAAEEGEGLLPTMAEERLPSAEGRFKAADFSDQSLDEPLAPLLEEKEGILAETDRLRAQLAALEAEQRAHGEAGTTEVQSSDERTDRATRLFWRQVAFEQHARLALNQLKQRNRRIDGRGDEAKGEDHYGEPTHALGDDSGLFAIAQEASAFALELRVTAGTMRGEELAAERLRSEGQRLSRVTDQRPVTSDEDADTGTDRFGFADLQRSRTEILKGSGTTTQADTASNHEVPATAFTQDASSDSESSAEDSRTTTAPRVHPSGSFEALPGVRKATLRRPVTEPRMRPSGTYQPVRPIEVESEEHSEAHRDFLRTEIPDPRGVRESHEVDEQESSASDGAAEQPGAAPGRSGPAAKPPPFRSPAQPSSGAPGGASSRDDSIDRSDDEFSTLFDDAAVGVFPDSYDKALDDALDELFMDPPGGDSAATDEAYDRHVTRSVLEDSAASNRNSISDIWLPPDALSRPGDSGTRASGFRRTEDTEQQPITRVRDDGRDLKFVHSFTSPDEHSDKPDSEAATQDDARDAEASASGSDVAVEATDDDGKPFERFGGRRGTGPTNTLLLSAVPAPEELREMNGDAFASGERRLPFDEFEEENTPVAGVERVSEVVLGKSGFRDPHESGRTQVVTAETELRARAAGTHDESDDSDIRDDDTVDLPGGSSLLKLLEGEPEPQERDTVSPASKGDKEDLRAYEPRPYVWAIASLMLVASILILLMAKDEDVQGGASIAVPQGPSEMEAGYRSGVIFAASGDADVPPGLTEIDPAALQFAVSYGGEAAKDTLRSAIRVAQPAAVGASAPE